MNATPDSLAAAPGRVGGSSAATGAAAAPKVSVRNLRFFYGSTLALKGINLDLPDRSITAFIAPLRLRQIHAAAGVEPHVRAVSRAPRRRRGAAGR